MTTRRYPLQPLLTTTGLTRRQLWQALHIHWHRYLRYETEGLTDTEADHHAIQLGHHPTEIWNNWTDPVTPHVVHDEAS